MYLDEKFDHVEMILRNSFMQSSIASKVGNVRVGFKFLNQHRGSIYKIIFSSIRKLAL
jgi:hypothetical protein